MTILEIKDWRLGDTKQLDIYSITMGACTLNVTKIADDKLNVEVSITPAQHEEMERQRLEEVLRAAIN